MGTEMKITEMSEKRESTLKQKLKIMFLQMYWLPN